MDAWRERERERDREREREREMCMYIWGVPGCDAPLSSFSSVENANPQTQVACA